MQRSPKSSQTSKMELSAKTVNGLQPLPFFLQKAVSQGCNCDTGFAVYSNIQQRNQNRYSVKVLTKTSDRKLKILVKVFTERREHSLIFTLTFLLERFS